MLADPVKIAFKRSCNIFLSKIAGFLSISAINWLISRVVFHKACCNTSSPRRLARANNCPAVSLKRSNRVSIVMTGSILAPTTSGAPTVAISGDSVEFEGFYISTAAGGTDNGLAITGDNVLIKNVWVKSATSNGIDVSSSTRTQIESSVVEDSVGTGIKIGASTSRTTVKQSILSGNGADGADLSGASVLDNIFENNLIFNNTGYGIDVGTGVVRTGVRLNHTFSGNTLGSTRDLGTGTFIETPAGGASATDIADAVWDEIITGHSTPGSVGQILKVTKLKATLASLK